MATVPATSRTSPPPPTIDRQPHLPAPPAWRGFERGPPARDRLFPFGAEPPAVPLRRDAPLQVWPFHHNGVHGKLRPAVQWQTLGHYFQPPRVMNVRCQKLQVSNENSRRDPRSCLTADPRSPEQNTACARCAVVALGVEWTATLAGARGLGEGGDEVNQFGEPRKKARMTNARPDPGPLCERNIARSLSVSLGLIQVSRCIISVREARASKFKLVWLTQLGGSKLPHLDNTSCPQRLQRGLELRDLNSERRRSCPPPEDGVP